MLPGVEPWFMAFWELSTCRAFEGGPIPWTAIQAWPVTHDEAGTFHGAIRDADRAYLAHLSKPREPKPTRVLGPGMLRGKT